MGGAVRHNSMVAERRFWPVLAVGALAALVVAMVALGASDDDRTLDIVLGAGWCATLAIFGAWGFTGHRRRDICEWGHPSRWSKATCRADHPGDRTRAYIPVALTASLPMVAIAAGEPLAAAVVATLPFVFAYLASTYRSRREWAEAVTA